MIGRHIIFAGLFAAASFANAGTVEASSATVQPAWSFNSGLGGSSAVTASQSMIAGPGTWAAHSRLGDVGSTSTMLFSQTGPFGSAAAPAQLSATPAPARLGSTPAPAQLSSTAVQAAAPAAAEMAAITFTETQVVTQAAAPAPTEMAAIVVNADIVAGAEAPAALAAAIPEPATGLLMLAGLLGAGFMRRSRK